MTNLWGKSKDFDYWSMAIQILQENQYDVFMCPCDSGKIYWEAKKYIDDEHKIYDRLVSDDILTVLGLMQILPDWKSNKKIKKDYYKKIYEESR